MTAPISLFTASLDATGHGERERTLLPRLAPNEQRRYAAFGSLRRRTSWLAGRAFLLAALERAQGAADPAALLTAEDSGVRYAAADIHLNLSHGGAWLAAALAKVPVGVDVELPRPRASVQEAARVFDAAEAERLAALPEPERLAAFYRLWTLKEAACKAAGLSIWDALRHACFDSAARRVRLDGPFPPGPWHFLQGRLEDGAQLALAWRGAVAEVESLRLREGAWHPAALADAMSYIRAAALS